MSCQEELKKLLANAGLKYECREHPEEYTAIAVAHSERIPPADMAKVVMCADDEGFAMFVILPSRLDMINAANQPAWSCDRPKTSLTSSQIAKSGLCRLGNLYGFQRSSTPH
jgi:hypothetical protein